MDEQRPEELIHDATEEQSSPLNWSTRESDGQFWSGKRGLTIVQLFGVVLIFLTVVGAFWSAIYWKLWAPTAKGSVVERLIANFGDWIILFAVFGVLFLLLRWRVHRALSASRETRQGRASEH